ncbi:lytic transglycosylase domain-containing protein [Pseudoroseicyclus sp. CXY001]|uniref:lytic murein transglycosylase n=1 Tax=Pseudoroseicyclus sp. CXY001 TaxID=3242492 RepID=UPI00358DD8E7
MPRSLRSAIFGLSALVALPLAAPLAAAPCGNDASGFAAWKAVYAQEAAAQGVGQAGLAALANASYAQSTINADRNQRGVRYELDEFMRIRWSDAYTRQARGFLAQYPDFWASLESAYGVPAEVILAIWGMETGFGGNTGNSNVLNAILTLAYDCRRPEFFAPHALAALKLVDRGTISGGSIGALHGELGHTQFLPGSILSFGVDGDGNGRLDMTNMTDALASTANYLRQHGWQPGQPYQEGTANFRVIEEWNAATVYQRAIALIASRIAAG